MSIFLVFIWEERNDIELNIIDIKNEQHVKSSFVLYNVVTFVMEGGEESMSICRRVEQSMASEDGTRIKLKENL